MLATTQRPSRVPVFLLSESAKWYCFTLIYPGDVEKMEAILPGYRSKMADKHTFAFFDIYESDSSVQVRLEEVKTNA